jgi:hypothetical protein
VRNVHRYRERGLAPEDIINKSGEITPRSHLNENAYACGVHSVNGLAEPYRAGPLRNSKFADLLRL